MIDYLIFWGLFAALFAIALLPVYPILICELLEKIQKHYRKS